MANESLILQANGNNGRTAGAMLAYRPSLDNGIIPIEFPFTRTTTGIERLSDGLWREAAINLPRRFYDGTKYSYLYEPARTNVVIHSSDPTQTAWTKLNINPTNTANTTPFQGVTARQLTATAAGAVRCQQIITGLTAGTNYIYQAWIKRGNVDNVTAYIGDSGEGIVNAVVYNFATNTFSGTGTGIQYIVSRTSEILNDGWVLITIAIVIPVGQTTLKFNSFLPVNGFGVPAINDNLLVAQTQVELGSSATSPIITAGSAVLRAADAPVLTNASALIGQTEGTILFDYVSAGLIADDLISLNGTSFDNNVTLVQTGAGAIRFIIFHNSLGFGVDSSVIAVAGTRYRVAFKYITGGCKIFVNGAQVGSSVSPFAFTGALSQIRMTKTTSFSGSATTLHNLVGLYRTALTDSECIALSQIPA